MVVGVVHVDTLRRGYVVTVSHLTRHSATRVTRYKPGTSQLSLSDDTVPYDWGYMSGKDSIDCEAVENHEVSVGDTLIFNAAMPHQIPANKTDRDRSVYHALCISTRWFY